MVKKGAKKKVKKNIATGVAHIQSTFNNTIITITDPGGGTLAWGSAGQHFKGLAEIDALRGAASRRGVCQARHGARGSHFVRLREGSGGRVESRRYALFKQQVCGSP